MFRQSSSSFSRYAFLRSSITTAFSWLLRLFGLTPSSFLGSCPLFSGHLLPVAAGGEFSPVPCSHAAEPPTASTSAAFSARNDSNAASLSGTAVFSSHLYNPPANSFSLQKFRLEWLTPYLFAIFRRCLLWHRIPPRPRISALMYILRYFACEVIR